MSHPLVAVVAADLTQRSVLEHVLRRAGFQVSSHAGGSSLRSWTLRVLPEVIVVAASLPAADREALLDWCRRTHPRTPRVLLSDGPAAVGAPGASGDGRWRWPAVEVAPSEPGPELLAALRRVVESARLARRVRCLERRVDGRLWGGLVGRSPALHALADELDRVAASEVNVLLHGEPGTGKAFVARALHEDGGRREGPFVTHDESWRLEDPGVSGGGRLVDEFGVTEAAAPARPSSFVRAQGGTLFVRGAGRLTPGLREALRRAVRERAAEHQDAAEPLAADYRLVVSSHEPLGQAARDGALRPELYEGIRGVELRLPPLRERVDDIPVLWDHFARLESPERGPARLTPQAAERLRAYRWPGNVRELRLVVRRALVTCAGEIDVHDLPVPIRDAGAGPAALSDDGPPPLPPDTLELRAVERWAIRRAVAACGGNMSEAAARLGIGRTTLYRKLDAYDLR